MNIKAMNVARIAKAVFADPKRYEPVSNLFQPVGVAWRLRRSGNLQKY